MTSSDSSVRAELEGYLAGRVAPERAVAVVAAEYYRDAGSEMRDALRPLIETIERAHPGVIELSSAAGRPGFAVRLAERPFPKRYEAEFRQGVEALLVAGVVSGQPTHPVSRISHPGFFSRIYAAVRRLFSA